MKHLINILLFSFVINAHAGIKSGIRAYYAGDYETAHSEFTSAAESRDPMGLHLLASLYYQGHGVEKNLHRAVELFTAAAKLGNSKSQANLGLMYHKGYCVEQNILKAIEFYNAARKQGDLHAAYNLGQIYRKGDGVQQDTEKAVSFYKFAAERGHVSAANEYGLMFAQGQGVALDYVKAFAWISFAAKSGNDSSVKNLQRLTEIAGENVGTSIEHAKGNYTSNLRKGNTPNGTMGTPIIVVKLINEKE